MEDQNLLSDYNNLIIIVLFCDKLLIINCNDRTLSQLWGGIWCDKTSQNKNWGGVGCTTKHILVSLCIKLVEFPFWASPLAFVVSCTSKLIHFSKPYHLWWSLQLYMLPWNQDIYIQIKFQFIRFVYCIENINFELNVIVQRQMDSVWIFKIRHLSVVPLSIQHRSAPQVLKSACNLCINQRI